MVLLLVRNFHDDFGNSYGLIQFFSEGFGAILNDKQIQSP